jgi:hypothetical protein
MHAGANKASLLGKGGCGDKNSSGLQGVPIDFIRGQTGQVTCRVWAKEKGSSVIGQLSKRETLNSQCLQYSKPVAKFAVENA